ncbi:acyl-homoserine-lactone synthase TraI [Rhizobium calliandrae]|uniref:Acyl-homoserine-lactone synthase n=1 Tax=Rhizobium calliandrae TaxID=1312182 RepID=A0ABT7KDT5_9HYPH|nr:acyl-homoserine-lactone synthase TraI [Rhizobium calliandrae]MDL2406160.1 acyl-homoserine-lactone synthase TraI [Rhizobium calliandrae]
MHVIAIRNPNSPAEHHILDQMHCLRARIFQGRLGWDVRSVDGREFDQFDLMSPTYIITLGVGDAVIGCARLLPAVGATMLATVFPQLLRGGKLVAHEQMIESSRFCVDTSCADGRGASLHHATLTMFAGIIEWCRLNGFVEIATATDVRFERILGRAGWPMQRLGEPLTVNETLSVAGILPADRASFERLRPNGYSSGFVAHRHEAA